MKTRRPLGVNSAYLCRVATFVQLVRYLHMLCCVLLHTQVCKRTQHNVCKYRTNECSYIYIEVKANIL